MDKKRILMIATGGTIACVETDLGLRPGLTGAELLEFVPEAEHACNLDTLDLFDMDSTNVTPAEWLAIRDSIEQHYDDYDGFVIAHGTDTMAYTAAGLSYLIQNSPKPIVITGAQLPMNSTFTDAKSNLYESLLYATDETAHDVCVVFGGVAIAGTRATKRRTSGTRAFESVNVPELAMFRHGKVVRTSMPVTLPNPAAQAQGESALDGTLPAAPDCASGQLAGKRDGGVRFYDKLNTRICTLKLAPGMDAAIFDAIMPLCDAVVVEGFGLGGLPSLEPYRRAIFDWLDSGRIMVVTSQAFEEGFDMSVYEVGRAYLEYSGMLLAGDMTCESLVAKTMWALGQTDDLKEVERLFYRPVNHDRLMR